MATTFTTNPQLGILLALANQLAVGGGGATATPAAEQPSPQVQAFLDAIPFANDGDVITADHHNTLRAALGRIARSLDETQFARVVTPSFPAALLPIDGAPAFRIAEGFAAGPKTGNTAAGWLPLDLPHGTTIDSLTVRGKRPGAVTIWSASLRRVDLAGGAPVDVCTKEIQSETVAAGGSFVAEIQPVTTGITAAQLSERTLVDTTRYRYHFHTTFAGATQADALEVHVVQVTCTRG
jgi:hypothetical protein